jgi:hypothetical protein
MDDNRKHKHGLYRRELSDEEKALFDHLVTDTDFDDLRREIALVRLIINRCATGVLSGSEWRVPLQVMPQYIEKLVKLIERMRPQAQRVILEDQLDTALTEMLNEEAASRLLKREARLEDFSGGDAN